MPSWASRGCLIAGAVAVMLGVVWLLATPGVPATCDKVFALAERAGETIEPSDRELCEQHYQRLRDARGAIGWAKLARCIQRAQTIPDAGGC